MLDLVKVRCFLLGHQESEIEIACDVEFRFVDFYCARCQKRIKTIPFSEAPPYVQSDLKEISLAVNRGEIEYHWGGESKDHGRSGM